MSPNSGNTNNFCNVNNNGNANNNNANNANGVAPCLRTSCILSDLVSILYAEHCTVEVS